MFLKGMLQRVGLAFFFSSRRRHTRFDCDWSSDVCSSDLTPVITRLGAGEAKNQKWPLSTDNKATFYPGDAAAFLEQLLAADRLVAQTTPYGESPITAVFDLAGLSAAVEALRGGWPGKGA